MKNEPETNRTRESRLRENGNATDSLSLSLVRPSCSVNRETLTERKKVRPEVSLSAAAARCSDFSFLFSPL